MEVSKLDIIIERLVITLKDGAPIRDIYFPNEFYVIGDVEKQKGRKTANAIGKTTMVYMLSYCLCGSLPTQIKPLEGILLDLYIKTKNGTRKLHRVIGKSSIWIDEIEYGLTEAKEILGIDRTYVHQIIHFDQRKNIILDTPNKYELYQIAYTLLGLNTIIQNTKEYYDIFNRKGTLDDRKKELEKELSVTDKFEISQKIKEYESKLKEVEEIQNSSFEKELEHLSEERVRLISSKNVLMQSIYTKQDRVGIISSYIKNTQIKEDDILNFISQANAELGGMIKKEISDVMEFHKAQSSERVSLLVKEKNYLISEIKSLKNELSDIDDKLPKIESIIQQDSNIRKLFSMYSHYSNEISKLKEVNIKYSLLESIENELDILKVKKLETYMTIKTQKLDMLNEKYGKYSNDIVKRIYPESFNSNFAIKFVDSSKVNTTGFPIIFEFNISNDDSEGVRNAKHLIVDLLMFKFSPEVNFMVWDSSVFNGIDPNQIKLLIEEIKTISRDQNKQYVICLNKFQVTDVYKTLLFDDEKLEDKNRLILSTKDQLMKIDF